MASSFSTIRALGALAVVLVPPVWGQFSGLATPYDGSVVYFTSTLRLKGTNEPNYGKLFVADENGVRLFRSRDEVDPAPARPDDSTCVVGTYYSFERADVTADGRTIAAQGRLTHAGYCNIYLRVTDLITAGGEQVLPGWVHLSPRGRYAIADMTMGPFNSAVLVYLDLQTGSRSGIVLPPVVGPWQAEFSSAGRVIADDGTAVFTFYDRAFVAHRGQDPQRFPVAGAAPLVIEASGRFVLYSKDGALRRFDLLTQGDQLILSDGADWSKGNWAYGMSDDGQRVLLTRGGQFQLIQSGGTGLRPVTADPTGFGSAILSGDGNIVYAVTPGGRLLKVNVSAGTQIEIIGNTPSITNSSAGIPGFVTSVSGSDFADAPLPATPPLSTTLGNVTVRIRGRAVPILQVAPTKIDFLVPWDLTSNTPNEQVPLTVETPGKNSLFEFPVSYIVISAGPSPSVAAIAHQNWDGLVTYTSPAHPGEIVHIWAAGLGPVSPELPAGAAAPSAEPLARLVPPLLCNDSEVLYAGLAPGYFERVYQVDLRLGDTSGYFLLRCSTAMNGSLFMQILVSP